ncbi:DUF3575 domain-containing protein [Haladaptatus sp. AB618]|uniref:DUF3575 domain-containing protein n=1 Tax=Haladaptatus sp. AB618 TaxID=2934173 RepID=UPI00209BE2B6|nr:DUF3575 domain-containing protein [Haladaptatus sp. AB618]MCO8254548.1 DUF3575 domain-containing protein [Haladaptatus sp. AB618]
MKIEPDTPADRVEKIWTTHDAVDDTLVERLRTTLDDEQLRGELLATVVSGLMVLIFGAVGYQSALDGKLVGVALAFGGVGILLRYVHHGATRLRCATDYDYECPKCREESKRWYTAPTLPAIDEDEPATSTGDPLREVV